MLQKGTSGLPRERSLPGGALSLPGEELLDVIPKKIILQEGSIEQTGNH